MAGSCACVSHAKPSAFLKDQLLIRSVLLLIDQKRWAWMTTLQSNHGHAREEIFFFLIEAPAWSKAAWSLRTTSHRSRQTGIAEGVSLFLPHMCAHSHSLHLPAATFSSLMHTKTNTHTSHTHVCVLFCYPPTTHTPCLSWPSVSFPAALPVWQRSRQSISVRGSDAEPEWQSDRGETWQTNSQ